MDYDDDGGMNHVDNMINHGDTADHGDVNHATNSMMNHEDVMNHGGNKVSHNLANYSWDVLSWIRDSVA